jgi:hypothetical protein
VGRPLSVRNTLEVISALDEDGVLAMAGEGWPMDVEMADAIAREIVCLVRNDRRDTEDDSSCSSLLALIGASFRIVRGVEALCDCCNRDRTENVEGLKDRTGESADRDTRNSACIEKERNMI